MFKRVLVPATPEVCQTLGLKRAGELASIFQGEVILMYSVGGDFIESVDRHAEYIMTKSQIQAIKDKVSRSHMEGTASVLLEKAQKDLEAKGIKVTRDVRKGRQVNEILAEVESKGVDLIVMEFHPHTLQHYTIFERSSVPIWIERNDKPIKRMLAITSNLARNQLVPQYATALAKRLGAQLQMVYIADKRNAHGELSPLREGELFLKGFEESHADIKPECSLVEGPLEKTALAEMEKRSPDLTVIGRTVKVRSLLGEERSIKVAIGKKATGNVLLLY